MKVVGINSPTSLKHLPLLDGWRALSIVLVLAGHLFPIGPSHWQLNAPVSATGMVLFFTLSGFLITRFLIEDGNVRDFLIRRLFRIVPLAWLGTLIAVALAGGGSASQVFANIFFFANLPPFFLLASAPHFWSLCLEVQFYLSIALLVSVGGRRALLLVPVLCLAVTFARVVGDAPITIVSWYRADEILAGATLALAYEGLLGERARKFISWPNFFLLLPLVFVSADPRGDVLPYMRPYLSALMIGASIHNAPQWLRDACRWRSVIYVAQISYALYVFHGLFMHSWLGSGEFLAKYAKRPLLLATTFICAHLSTFYYERRFISLSRSLTNKN